MRCSPDFELPEFDQFDSTENVFLHLRTTRHNDSFVIEIVSVTNDQDKAMPLYGIHQVNIALVDYYIKVRFSASRARLLSSIFVLKQRSFRNA